MAKALELGKLLLVADVTDRRSGSLMRQNKRYVFLSYVGTLSHIHSFQKLTVVGYSLP